jgi:hypothetical protein
MDIRGIEGIEDLIFDEEKGRIYVTHDTFLTKINYRGYGKKRKYKDLFWENDEFLKQTPAVCYYAIHDTKAILDKSFLTFFDVKEILLKNGMPSALLSDNFSNININYISRDKVIIYHGLIPFCILYSLKDKSVKKINFDYNVDNLRKSGGKKTYIEPLSFCHSKKFFYFAQNLRNYMEKKNHYRVFQYDFEGNLKLIFNFENLIPNGKEKSFVCIKMLVTPNEKLVVDEVYFEKNKQGQVKANVLKVVYNIPEILKANESNKKLQKNN